MIPLMPFTETLKMLSPFCVDSLKTLVNGSFALAPIACAEVCIGVGAGREQEVVLRLADPEQRIIAIADDRRVYVISLSNTSTGCLRDRVATNLDVRCLLLLAHANSAIAVNSLTGSATGDREVLKLRIIGNLDAEALVVWLDFFTCCNKRIAKKDLTTTDLDTLRVVKRWLDQDC